jgi:hypothetical protein
VLSCFKLPSIGTDDDNGTRETGYC